jgi:enoyl-CoA hydratase
MKTTAALTVRDGTAEILFSPEFPGKPPTVDYELLDSLEAHIKKIAARGDEINFLFLRSASPKYFVVGANLEVLRTVDKDTIIPWVERGHEVFNLLEECPVPTAAVVTGFALGGGLELAMACDYILAADTAKFGQPEAGLGFIPGWGGCCRLPERIGAARAKELFFTGRTIDAEEAFRLGLVNFTGTAEALEAYIAEMIAAVRNNSALSVRMIKKIVNTGITENRRLAVFAEAAASGVCLASGDTARRLREFFEKREKK